MEKLYKTPSGMGGIFIVKKIRQITKNHFEVIPVKTHNSIEWCKNTWTAHKKELTLIKE